jgi:hypothetical protein
MRFASQRHGHTTAEAAAGQCATGLLRPVLECSTASVGGEESGKLLFEAHSGMSGTKQQSRQQVGSGEAPAALSTSQQPRQHPRGQREMQA